MSEFQEGIFICACIFTGIGSGVLILHGLGLVIMRIRDLRTGKGRLLFLTRVL